MTTILHLQDTVLTTTVYRNLKININICILYKLVKHETLTSHYNIYIRRHTVVVVR